ncbi:MULTISPECIES: beta strand repeat-containing protein [unclassified Chryseobacterium]|uniref:beta strand repeat-containing protein n=1 Tax=unclassified Chryseobacterium TaxID=2593645 RepID=UPI000D39C73D|nr:MULTISPECIES: hypothetical protein [unclassified Chryseobacterium]PTT73186.1 hypothetical protein DBR25_13490 [Chryseobacterium sp. HMWF001]PVV51649.1 hypothetical protein DD829_20160 [Chryseobacterium sp. HMWF035]
MKLKINLLIMMVLLATSFIGNYALAQTVSGTPSNTGCQNSGIVTASSTGLGATPQYQLLKSGVVVAPVSGDATQFTNTTTFIGLVSGTYVLKGRALSGGTIYSSASITVTDGYTAMSVTTPTKVATCTGASVALTTTVTGGKSPFVYKIATQAAPSTYLETGVSTASASYTFAALPVGSYLVSVTDACGQTVTGATSISNPTVSLADIKLGSVAYVSRSVVGNCSSPLRMVNELGFRYVTTGSALSTADAALFTWKIKFQGVLYGQDTNADGYSDTTGAGYLASTNNVSMPLVATRAAILADEPNTKIVLIDACGNTKEFSIVNYNKVHSGIGGQNSCGNAQVKVGIGAGMSCLPINFVFTNTTNPADVVTVTQTTNGQTFSGFTPGATYHYTYVDASGYTSSLYSNTAQNVGIPATPQFVVTQFAFGTQQSLNNLNYGVLGINVAPSLAGDAVTATVIASSNPLVSVGASVSGTLQGNGNWNVTNINATDPVGYWPKGNYTLSVSSGCGTKLINVVVQGYNASLSGNTLTPVCGGFNYVMNGTFDVQSAYQVIIVSGPTSVGQVRDLASTTASLPFNGLSYGTYVFGLRIKGGSTNVLTQTVTYSAANAITVDTTNTGGYVCSAGATNGTLTIVATTNSPSPGNTLEYALSLDGGATFGAYQSGNSFSGLASGTYYFKVKDGCGNVITQSAQIGVAAAPVVSVNGVPGDQSLCNTHTGETVMLTLDVNIPSATYAWTGNGITAANSNLKNPVISVADMSVGVNNYSCTITLGAPCNATSVGNVAITILANPTVVITNPAAVCFPNTVSITPVAVTTGSDAGLTYTYFTDAVATTTLASPSAIAVSGTYYIKGTNSNGCYTIKPVTVTINPLPIATITYSNSPYCKRGTATVTQSGVTGGTYSSDAGVSINASTGAINLAASTTGNHTVTYSFTNGTCANTTTAIITINASTLPTALADITAQCNTTLTAPTLSDPCAGVITATTTTTFPITTQGTTVVTWTFNYGNGYTQTVTQNVINTTCACTKPAATGSPTQYTKMGITVQQKQSAWPENIPNGFMALESKEKGFVITRVQNEAQITDPKEGMIIYDMDANCVKLYNGTVWNCIKKTCND